MKKTRATENEAAEQNGSGREKIRIKELLVVEGRDDTLAVKRGVDADTIETHGFGLSDVFWERAETAYKTRGLIVFTDPDHAGEEIRKKVLERFPAAKQAFLDRAQAEKAGDIGIENASPEDIQNALLAARATAEGACPDIFSEDMLWKAGLTGTEGAAGRRREVGKLLGIGYGNTGTFVRRLNRFGITEEEFYEAVQASEKSGTEFSEG